MEKITGGQALAQALRREGIKVVFGIPGADYPSARTIEPRPEGDQRPGFDKLILTADRHSLILELRENPGHLDQVRVLVEAN